MDAQGGCHSRSHDTPDIFRSRQLLRNNLSPTIVCRALALAFGFIVKA